ncbi:MAG: hypothetical protein LBT01_02025 [Spirochaetaceae bacterium]|jgi:hypothetical protein|nr:hypothetical protein [Spirochaetaceae bacterium]
METAMIHYDIPEPGLSPNFTIDDIHKVRRGNCERLKDATVEEQIADIHRRAAHGWEYLEKLRREREAASALPSD